jgi:biopolymer transport protein ExbD
MDAAWRLGHGGGRYGGWAHRRKRIWQTGLELLFLVICAVAVAQSSDETPLLVTIDTTMPDAPFCRVERTEIDCSKVGETLLSMGVPALRAIHIRGDGRATFQVLDSLLESLMKAGYAKVAFAKDEVSREAPLRVMLDTTDPNAPICRAEEKEVDCSIVAERLQAIGVPITREIHISVDKQARYELILSVLTSLQNAGYTNIGFKTDSR